MSPQEKQVLEAALKYLEMLNSHIEALYRRLPVAEGTIKARPELLAEYQRAEKDMRLKPDPGLHVQLGAIRQTIEQLR